MFTQDDVIHTYTREQALADGVLVAVPEDMQKEAGFRVPIAMTSRVHENCVAWTVEDSERQQVHQDQDARLWDVLMVARFAAHCEPNKTLVAFDLLRYLKHGSQGHARRVRLVMQIHPDDTGAPCVTIMFPDED